MAASSRVSVLVVHVVAALSSLFLLAEGQTVTNGSLIEAIRLVDRNGHTGGIQGRVEIRYRGQWGTICDSGWYTDEADVACGMLGFEGALCAVRSSSYFGYSSRAAWMNNVNCNGYESALDFCYYQGLERSGSRPYCSRYHKAGVVCRSESIEEEVGTPSNIKLIKSTTTSLTIGWTAPASPSWATYRRFTIWYQPVGGYARSRTYYNSSFINETGVEMSYTLTSLTRDSQYSIKIRASVRNSACYYYYYTYGNYSEAVSFRTNATRKTSNIPIRLISPTPGVNFLGRVEVYHNNQWGTVCDDRFYTTEANVVCQMLNFTQGAACSVSSARFGRGQGPIWLDDVDCQPGDEVLEDCDHRPWGNTSCSHYEDVGVVCRPNADDGYSAVKNLTVISVGPTVITVGWSPYIFPPDVYYTGFQLRYTDSNGYTRTTSTYSYYTRTSITRYTLNYLELGEEYEISVRAFFEFSSCYSYIYGAYSDNVTATTMETAPTAPPRDFYVAAINKTAIQAEWDSPPLESSGGIILGYKLFVRDVKSGRDWVINITHNDSTYTIGGLQPATSYRLSVLAYTRVGDGPKSIHLTVPTLRFDPLITQFGYYGNGQDRITRYTSSYSYYPYYGYGRVHIHCASNNFISAPPHWFFANGSAIGVIDRSFQVGHFPQNATAVLKIADYRPLSYCDGGIFTCCVVNNITGHSQEKNFTLTINSSPPAPGKPYLIRAQSSSITIGWSEAACNGGHTVNNFVIRFRQSFSSYYSSYTYIRSIDPAQRNYTVTGLQSNTFYSFSIQAVNLLASSSSYSSSLSATTMPPAPSSPRDVTARLVAPLKVEVKWRAPAAPNGDISHYYVYAVPLVSSVTSSNPETLKMAYPGSARAGNITLAIHSITYHFQVSAAVSFGQTYNEGDLSRVNANTSLFVPKPGLPVPTNPHITRSSNASISLMWNYPPPPSEAVEMFMVTYSGEVEWVSPNRELVQFEDAGAVNTSTNYVTITALIPGTMYSFKVSTITRSGRGAEVMVDGQTASEVSLAYIQLRMGPIQSCFDFMDFTGSNTDDLDIVRQGLVKELSHLCPSCGISAANIKEDEFSCRNGLTNQIVYRARIVGTDVYSATGLVSLVQSWVASDTASIMVGSSRLHLDPTCPTTLDSLFSPDCINDKSPTKAPVSIRSHVSVGEIAGISTGVAIVILLIILITVIAMKKWRPKIIRRYARFSRAPKPDDVGDDMPLVDDDDHGPQLTFYDDK